MMTSCGSPALLTTNLLSIGAVMVEAYNLGEFLSTRSCPECAPRSTNGAPSYQPGTAPQENVHNGGQRQKRVSVCHELLADTISPKWILQNFSLWIIAP